MASRYNLRVKPRPPNQPTVSPTAKSLKLSRPPSKKARSKETGPNLDNSATLLPHLPVEIMHHIISSCFPDISLLDPSAPLAFQNREHSKKEAVSLDPYHHFATTFLQFLLVCQNWALITQRIFYHTLVIWDTMQLSRLAATLQIWDPHYTQSPLRHVRRIHLCAELEDAEDKVDKVVLGIRAATQDILCLETLALSHLGTYRVTHVPWLQFTEILSDLSVTGPFLSTIPPSLLLSPFCSSIQTLHVHDTVFEVADDDGNSFRPIFPALVELHLTVRGHSIRPPFHEVEPFAPGNWLMPSLRSITVSGWHWRGLRDTVNFLPFLRKYGQRVEHFFLDGFPRYRSRMLSSSLSPDHIQECLDALPELRHLVLTQMPWMAFKSQGDEPTQFSHPKLAWIDYGIVPSTVNFLHEDNAEFSPNPLALDFSSSDVPRIRGGARTKSSPRWGNETYVKLKTPGPVPPGWGSGLPNLQGMRKVDFSLFRLMPALTRDTLPPATGRSAISIPLSRDAVIRETKGKVYLWIPDAALREVFYNEWKLDAHEDVQVGL